MRDFEERLKVGKKAEKIVMNLLQESGFSVFRYGYEYTTPKLKKFGLVGEAGEYIKHMPDLIAVNSENEAFFIEVKYRSNSVIHRKNLFRYPSCYVFLLTNEGILGQKISSLYKEDGNFKEIRLLPPFKKISIQFLKKYDRIIMRKLGDQNLLSQFWRYQIKGRQGPPKNAQFKNEGLRDYQDLCPNCNKVKDKTYDLCYNCYTKAKK